MWTTSHEIIHYGDRRDAVEIDHKLQLEAEHMDVPAVVVHTADVLHAVVRARLLYHRVVHNEAAGLAVGLAALTGGYAQERLAARIDAKQTDQAAAAAAEHGLAAQAEQAEEEYQHGAGDTLLLLHAQAVNYLGDAENAVKIGVSTITPPYKRFRIRRAKKMAG